MDYSLLLSNNHDEFVMCILHCLHRYVSPEYASTGMLNEASDIYSFGVLLMEIISGRNPVDYGRPVGEVRHNKMDPLIKMAISTFQHMAYQLDCFAGKFGGVVQGDDWEAARWRSAGSINWSKATTKSFEEGITYLSPLCRFRCSYAPEDGSNCTHAWRRWVPFPNSESVCHSLFLFSVQSISFLIHFISILYAMIIHCLICLQWP